MKTKPHANTHKSSSTQTNVKAKCIKLGIDVHADSYRVVRQIDDATPQPAQKFSPQGFLLWVAKQLDQAESVHSCYEAGPFGYALHRKLQALGIHNVVICPQNWDERGKGVKTDKTDALAMAQRLDRYVKGNLKALAVIRVPTVEEEQTRAQSRQRQQLMEHRKRLEAQGRSLMLYNDLRVRGRWWSPHNWPVISRQVSAPLLELLETFRALILEVDEKLKDLTRRVEERAGPTPRGFGKLTTQILQDEVGDWNRFDNRRQVASLTGLCPGVRASGNSVRTGCITRHGNPRLRRALIELAWRVIRFQPDYPPVCRWKPVLLSGKGGDRKKAVVAIARKLAIDHWRLVTARCTAQDLSLKIN